VTDGEYNKIFHDEDVSNGTELVTSAKAAGVIECIFPPHDQELRNKLFKKAMYSLPCDSSGGDFPNSCHLSF
jgi:hypothetical protein